MFSTVATSQRHLPSGSALALFPEPAARSIPPSVFSQSQAFAPKFTSLPTVTVHTRASADAESQRKLQVLREASLTTRKPRSDFRNLISIRGSSRGEAIPIPARSNAYSRTGSGMRPDTAIPADKRSQRDFVKNPASSPRISSDFTFDDATVSTTDVRKLGADKFQKAEVPEYNAHLTEFGCNMGTIAYVPVATEGVHAEFSRSSGIGHFTGICSLIYGAKEAHRCIAELYNVYYDTEAEGRHSKMFELVLKTYAYAQWMMNGLASIAATLASLLPKLKEVLKGVANFGPIAGIIAAGTLMCLDAKDLYYLLTAKEINWKEVKTKVLSLIANICMFVAPLLFLLAAASQPHIVFAAILILGIISVLCHVAKEWDWFKEHKAQGCLYILAMLLSFYLMG